MTKWVVVARISCFLIHSLTHLNACTQAKNGKITKIHCNKTLKTMCHVFFDPVLRIQNFSLKFKSLSKEYNQIT